jgi:hypothetical protein
VEFIVTEDEQLTIYIEGVPGTWVNKQKGLLQWLDVTGSKMNKLLNSLSIPESTWKTYNNISVLKICGK